MLKWIGIGIVALAVALGFGSKHAKRELPIHPVNLEGKVAIVTGASAGIGKYSALILADWNATVIMAVRNEEKGQKVLDDIRTKTKNGHLEVWKLDLADFSSVQAFAERFLASKLPLHILMNNAGLVSWDKVMTVNNHELTYQTNHLGHFLLTKLLLKRLQESAPARVVQVSSEAHYMGSLDLDNLDAEKSYGNAMKVYANSKLMNVIFANELTKRYQHTGVVSSSLHPGFVATEFLRDVPKLLEPVKKAICGAFARDEYQGALTQVWAATHPALEGKGGIYLDSCAVVAQNPKAQNETLAAEFWEISERAVADFVLPEEEEEERQVVTEGEEGQAVTA